MVKAEYFLFSDASFDLDSKMGAGAILILTDKEWLRRAEAVDFPVQTSVMQAETIARLELMTVLWALDVFEKRHSQVLVHLFTDCKTIVDLPERRKKLEARSYRSQRTGRILGNADLYRKFFEMYDRLHPTIDWIEGHSPAPKRNDLQRMFATVDKAARRRLREFRHTGI